MYVLPRSGMNPPFSYLQINEYWASGMYRHTVSVLFIAEGCWGFYIAPQPTLIKIDFFVSKCMLYIWLQAQETKTKDTLSFWNNPYALQQSAVPFRSCWDYNIEQTFPHPYSQKEHVTGGGKVGEGSIPLSELLITLRLPSSPPLRGTTGLEEPSAAAQLKNKQRARVLTYFSSSALSSRRRNQFSFGQQ